MEGKNERLYRIWSSMKQRCNNPKNPSARWYYDKGIKVCAEWENDFYAFQSWALMHGYEDWLTIDRIDPDSNYCPDNCRWLTREENSRRARSGVTKGFENDEEHIETHADRIARKIDSLPYRLQAQAIDYIEYLAQKESGVLEVAVQILKNLPKQDQEAICEIIFKYNAANKLARIAEEERG